MNKDRLKKIIKGNFSIIAVTIVAAMILYSVNTNIALFSGKDARGLEELNDTSNVTLDVSDEDKKTLDFLYLSYDVITGDLNCITKAAKNKNLTDTERCAKFLKEDSNRTIGQMDSYNKSNYSQELELYKKYLEYYNSAGKILEAGAINMNARQMYNASVYIQKANYGMTNLMYSSNETNLMYSSNETNLMYSSNKTNLMYSSNKTNLSTS